MSKEKKQKKTKSKNATSAKNAQTTKDTSNKLPDFIDEKLWDEFAKLREIFKKPLNDLAKSYILADLQKYESQVAGSANASLQNSINNSFTAVFNPNTGTLHKVFITDEEKLLLEKIKKTLNTK